MNKSSFLQIDHAVKERAAADDMATEVMREILTKLSSYLTRTAGADAEIGRLGSSGEFQPNAVDDGHRLKMYFAIRFVFKDIHGGTALSKTFPGAIHAKDNYFWVNIFDGQKNLGEVSIPSVSRDDESYMVAILDLCDGPLNEAVQTFLYPEI